ncbi:MAG TPA: prolipoprotein diacylglyceryl transferase [Stellaceae bacterium]|jgi:phosphatidylglycerol:prolipoprotein diacylglycerol transferase|nr:prolipoprotein diacylglyceryl transferase [Stellaceae bacterium]
MLVIPYPPIDPVLIEIGPFAIRWYALAYIAGLLIGWRYCVGMTRRPPPVLDPAALDDFLVWVTLGVVLGGRIGYVLFYNLGYYLQHPIEALKIWTGGMSFHGGAIGVVLAMFLFTRLRKIDFLRLGDMLVCAVPIGLFLGRLANFINGELYGRPTDVWWAMVFPTDETRLPRHPSQLYEAALEGVVLFLVLFVLQRFTRAREYRGFLSGVFLSGYAISRIIAEYFREPDRQLGYLLGGPSLDQLGGLTMGQLLSIPVLIVGVWLIRRSRREAAAA